MSIDVNEIHYEGVFLDNDKVAGLFKSVRGETPYEKETQDFHITTAYRPTEIHPQWYGKEVDVHIIAYKIQDIFDDDNAITSNEGFKVTVKADDEELDKSIFLG